jgi:hypothetical protein
VGYTGFNLCYKNQSVIVYREIIAVYSETHTKHMNTAVWAERGICECQMFSLYRAVKTLRLGYTNQSVNAV